MYGFSTTIRWFGQTFSSYGISFYPQRIEGTRNMVLPHMGADLQQFLCAMQWISALIPDFSSVIHPLEELLERVYTIVAERTLLASVSISLLSSCWNCKHED